MDHSSILNPVLTDQGRDKIALISQTTYSNQFSCMKIASQWSHLQQTGIGLDNGLRQVTIWTNDGLFQLRTYASYGRDKLSSQLAYVKLQSQKFEQIFQIKPCSSWPSQDMQIFQSIIAHCPPILCIRFALLAMEIYLISAEALIFANCTKKQCIAFLPITFSCELSLFSDY